MRRKDTAVTVMTVLGPVALDALGIALAHEHVLIDIRNQYTEPADPHAARVGGQPVSAAHIERLQRNPYALRDNLVLDDLDLAVEELSRFRAAGGRTVVDCTPVGAGRNARGLRDVAQRTGLNIVAGCGYYTADTHPPELAGWSAEAIAARMVRDLTEGMDGSGIKAGMIGEIGTSNPIAPDECKCLRAAAIASRATGAPINVHTYPWCRAGLTAADLLLGEGLAPTKIVICHTDVNLDLEYMTALLARGVFLEFDNFGKEYRTGEQDHGFAGGAFASDPERACALQRLLEKGYESQLLITGDICLKSLLHAFGGRGYDHVLTNIVPLMLQAGIPQETVDKLLIANPARLFAAA
ncbi:MAG: phosphotriesterase-related protein [Kiritimatiellae bacterium]|nr:phosphotriesterase-related protein [Kiritimatiellia bacterium]